MKRSTGRSVPLRGTLRHKPGAQGGESFLNNAESPGAGPNVSRDTSDDWSRMFPDHDRPMGALKGLAFALLLAAAFLLAMSAPLFFALGPEPPSSVGAAR